MAEFALNDAQKAVIKHASGPLLVVAGAGTGKTRVIVEKVNALLDDGVQPTQILAVTFTEKAASEMLDRILQSRSGLLLDLNVMTFNSFGDSILREFGVHIGLPRTFRLLSEQARIVFFRERLDEFDLEHLLPLTGQPDGIIEEILRHISRLKQLVITPQQYLKAASQLDESDEAATDFKKEQLVLARTYDTYVRLCREESVIDYDDQIYLAVQLLESRASIRAKLQQRFQTIFVDEFQDTNPMQSRLIDLLAGEQKNLIVVGDDDQSIYGFRGATIANIMQFKERYPETKEIALTQNYRSHQEILDASYRLITNNNPHRLESTLGISKRLISTKQGQPPKLLRFETNTQEMSWIAEDIAQRLSKLKAGEPASLAVLTRSNSAAADAHRALLVAGVAHRVVGVSQDLYTKPVVRTLLELARTIAEPSNNLSLHHSLIGPLFNLPNDQISVLSNKARYEHESLEDLLQAAGDESILQALAIITSLRQYATHNSVGKVLYHALEKTGYKERVMKEAEGDQQAENTVNNLGQFFNSLKEFERIAIQPSITQYLVSLPALMAAGENVDDTLELNENEVIVTTIHKAKGLEWDTVYIPRQTSRSFSHRQLGPAFDLPKSILSDAEDPAAAETYEKRRLMYVAITRARENLYISFTGKAKAAGSKSEASPLINEIFGDGAAESAAITDVEAHGSQLEVAEDDESKIAIPGKFYDGEVVRLSVSQAQALLSCPLNFKYKFILGAPEQPNVSTSYGSQLHTYFEEINIGRRDGNLRSLDEMHEELTKTFDKSGYASKKQRDQALQRAQQTLKHFYEGALANTPAKFTEHEFEVRLPGDVLLHGRIDAIFERADGIDIVDYKTGDSVKTQEKANKKAGESKQLTMYALAWQIMTGEIPNHVTLCYPDTQLTASKTKQDRSLRTIENNLSKAVENLKNGIFPLGHSHDYCIHP